MEQATIDKVTDALVEHGSYRKTAAALEIPYTLVRDVVKGKHRHVSLARENQLRLTLALPILPQPITIPPCKDCGGAHYGDCNNKPVAIRPVRGKREPQRIIDYTVGHLAWAIRERVEI